MVVLYIWTKYTFQIPFVPQIHKSIFLFPT